jgi:hypothetical protein
LRLSSERAHYYENQHPLKFRNNFEFGGNSWLAALRTSSVTERSINAAATLAAEREKQTRKQLEDALAPNAHLRAIEHSPEHSS